MFPEKIPLQLQNLAKNWQQNYQSRTLNSSNFIFIGKIRGQRLAEVNQIWQVDSSGQSSLPKILKMCEPFECGAVQKCVRTCRYRKERCCKTEVFTWKNRLRYSRERALWSLLQRLSPFLPSPGVLRVEPTPRQRGADEARKAAAGKSEGKIWTQSWISCASGWTDPTAG